MNLDAHMLEKLLDEHGADAVKGAREALLEFAGSGLESSTNALSTLGDLLSWQLRRRVLRATLVANEWNLSRTAFALSIPNGPSPVKRMIRDLELQDEYDAAIAAGKYNRGGRPRKDRSETP
jgi:hypothetical protein